MLMGFHTWVNDRVQIDGGAADIDWYECVRGKPSTQQAAFDEELTVVPQKRPFTRAEGFHGTVLGFWG